MSATEGWQAWISAVVQHPYHVPFVLSKLYDVLDDSLAHANSHKSHEGLKCVPHRPQKKFTQCENKEVHLRTRFVHH